MHERTLEARKNSEKLCFELFAGAKIEQGMESPARLKATSHEAVEHGGMESPCPISTRASTNDRLHVTKLVIFNIKLVSLNCKAGNNYNSG